MTLKSYAQQGLENRHGGKAVRDIIIAELERLRGKPFLVADASFALRISGPTLRAWCRDLGIDIEDYRSVRLDA